MNNNRLFYYSSHSTVYNTSTFSFGTVFPSLSTGLSDNNNNNAKMPASQFEKPKLADYLRAVYPKKQNEDTK